MSIWPANAPREPRQKRSMYWKKLWRLMRQQRDAELLLLFQKIKDEINRRGL